METNDTRVEFSTLINAACEDRVLCRRFLGCRLKILLVSRLGGLLSWLF